MWMAALSSGKLRWKEKRMQKVQLIKEEKRSRDQDFLLTLCVKLLCIYVIWNVCYVCMMWYVCVCDEICVCIMWFFLHVVIYIF